MVHDPLLPLITCRCGRHEAQARLVVGALFQAPALPINTTISQFPRLAV